MTNLIISSLMNLTFQPMFEFFNSILAFKLDLNSIFVIFSIFYYFFFRTKLLDNAALGLLIYSFYREVSTLLTISFSIFFQVIALTSTLFFPLTASVLALFFTLTASTSPFFIPLAFAFFLSYFLISLG